MLDLPRWTALISRLKGEEQSNEELLRDNHKIPAKGQNGSDRGKDEHGGGRGG